MDTNQTQTSEQPVVNEEEIIELESDQEILEDLPDKPIGIGARLPTRNRQAPGQWWKPWEPQQSNAARESHGEPRSYAEAMQRPDKNAWERAATDEMSNHAENNTWSLVPRPENCVVIGS